MPPEELLHLLRKRPFVPFRIHLTDGTVFEIRHPEMVMPGVRTAIIGVPADPLVPLYARTEVVSLLHIVRLEPLDSTSTAAS